MTVSYNLLKEPWLLCITEKNQLQPLSLVDTILQAHHIRSIQADLPITTGSLYLFLIAFVMSALRLERVKDWESLWKMKQFPEKEVLDYAHQWEDRFDLFDPQHPFYQDPKFGEREKDIKNLKKGKSPVPKAISGLLLHLASGNNATLFDHSIDDMPQSYSLPQTAQLLIMIQAFSLGGMSSASISKDKYYKDAPFGRGILFLNQGENLFESLILNCPSEDFGPLGNTQNDKPCWEMEDPFELDRFAPQGIKDLFTWQSRRILLLPEEKAGRVTVKTFYVAPGYGLVENYSNPFYQNRISDEGKKQSIKPLRFFQGRSLWRDSIGILDISSKYSKPAISVLWAESLKGSDRLDLDQIVLDLFGMCTEPGRKKAYFYSHEVFSAPMAYFDDQSLLEDLEVNLNLAEQVRSNLYIAVRELARYKLAPNHDQENISVPGREVTDPLIQHWNAESQYWGKLETPFYEFLFTLPQNQDSAIDQWEKALRKAARDALEYAADQVGTDPAGLKARAKAEKTLNILLSKTFNPLGEE
jgi:CRISPR system Cascade subunit CasA